MRKLSILLVALFGLLLFVEDAQAFRRRRQVVVVNNVVATPVVAAAVNVNVVPAVSFGVATSASFSTFGPRPVFVGFDRFGNPIFR